MPRACSDWMLRWVGAWPVRGSGPAELWGKVFDSETQGARIAPERAVLRSALQLPLPYLALPLTRRGYGRRAIWTGPSTARSRCPALASTT